MLELTSPLEMAGPFLGRLAHVSPALLAIALALQLLKVGVMSQVWRRILQAAYPSTHIRTRDTVAPYVAGVGINAVVPAKAGVLARAVLMKRRLPGATYEGLTMTMLVESLLGMVALVGLLPIAIAMGVVPSPAGFTPHTASLVPGGAPVALLASLFRALAVVRGGRRRAGLRDSFRRFRQGAAILGRAKALSQALLGTVAAWALRLSCICAFLAAFGLDSTPRTVLLVVIAQMLSSFVPIAPNGAGAQQGLMVLLLAGVATPASILTFSLGMQAAIALVDVVAGAVALAAHGNPLRVLHEIRATPDDALPLPAT